MNYGVSGATVKQAKLATPAGKSSNYYYKIAYAEIKDTTTNTTTTVLYIRVLRTANVNSLDLGNGKTINPQGQNIKVLFDGNGKPADNALFTTLYGDKISPADIVKGKVNADGTLTVTERTVTNSAIIVIPVKMVNSDQREAPAVKSVTMDLYQSG